MQQPPHGYPQQQYAQQPPPPKKGMSTAAKVLIGLAGAFVLGAGGCVVCIGIGAKAAADKVGANRGSSLTAKAARPREVPAVQINDLLGAYKGNEVRADQEYKGNYYAVAGTVDAVKKGLMDDMFVTVGTGKMLEIPQVQCNLNDDQATKAASLSKGQKVTVAGRVEGLMMNVQLRDCEIQ